MLVASILIRLHGLLRHRQQLCLPVRLREVLHWEVMTLLLASK
jgi:hypothetical protein